jgi:hypothetical protein
MSLVLHDTGTGSDVLPLQWTIAHGQEPPIMVFVKNFDVAHQTLCGIGHFYVHRHMRVLDLALMINERMGFLPNTPLKVYEVRPSVHPVPSAVLTLPTVAGDQAEYDRADEDEGDVSRERDPGWRYRLLPGRHDRQGVRSSLDPLRPLY